MSQVILLIHQSSFFEWIMKAQFSIKLECTLDLVFLNEFIKNHCLEIYLLVTIALVSNMWSTPSLKKIISKTEYMFNW